MEYGSILPTSRKQTNSATATTYKTKDGRWLQLAMLQYDTQLPRFVKVSGADFLLDDPRFNTYEAMLQNIPVMVEALEPVFAQFTLNEWVDKLTEADIPFEIVQTMEEVATDDQNWANDYIYKKTTPDGKNVYYARTPVFFTERPAIKDEEGRIGRCPYLGEDSVKILEEIGYSSNEIADMERDGVIIQDHKHD